VASRTLVFKDLKMKKSIPGICLLLMLILSACGPDEEREGVVWNNIEKQLQSKFITAKEGDTIRLEEGFFAFTRSLILDSKKNITIAGAGIDKTILSFKWQEEGAEGIRAANCKNITFQDFTIEDAKGDNIKVTDTDGITFSRVKAYWTGGAKETNGAYGLYPVLCTNVIVESCIAARASDAGIYVGQSDTVIIRNCLVYENVAGIESENSNHVEIYENTAKNNTGGILVFDLPGLTQYGSDIQVYKNNVISNNHVNFAPKGNIVGIVPPGTGIMLLATRKVEIFENTITNNRTVGTALVSYELVNAMEEEEEKEAGSAAKINNNYKLDSLYNPYYSDIYIHDNIYRNKHWFPTMKSDFGKLFLFKFPFRTPDILLDGFRPPHEEWNICISNQEKTRFANLDAPGDFENIDKSIKNYSCNIPTL
jgi:parallel beta-helix repeat protein